MSYGTSNTTTISSPKPESHNLNTTNTSAAPDTDDPPPPYPPNCTAENRQLTLIMHIQDIPYSRRYYASVIQLLELFR